MSRNPKPTVEELRCVYDLILRSYEDADILAEYAQLYENGNLMFPYRTDKRFVRERRKELEAASEVLQEHVKKKIDPIVVKRRGEHFAQLASVAKSLLANDLESVLEKQTETLVDYTVTSQDGLFYTLDKDDLSNQLDDNLQSTFDKYKDWFIKYCFIPHLEAELPEEIKAEGLWDGVINEKPYELIYTLRLLAERRTFKDTCPVCKDW